MTNAGRQHTSVSIKDKPKGQMRLGQLRMQLTLVTRVTLVSLKESVALLLLLRHVANTASPQEAGPYENQQSDDDHDAGHDNDDDNPIVTDETVHTSVPATLLGDGGLDDLHNNEDRSEPRRDLAPQAAYRNCTVCPKQK